MQVLERKFPNHNIIRIIGCVQNQANKTDFSLEGLHFAVNFNDKSKVNPTEELV